MIAGIILAAGEGKRFGMPKALAMHKQNTFLEHQHNLLKNFCAPLMAVVGADSETVKKKHRHLYIIWSVNSNWKEGQFSSIQSGMRDVPDNHAVIILPVDVLNIKQETIKLIVEAYKNKPSSSAVVPTYMGKSGHPILISQNLINKLSQFTIDSRLDEVIRNLNSILKVEVDDESILNNVNKQEDIKLHL